MIVCVVHTACAITIGQNKAELEEELERATNEVLEQKKKCTDLQQVIRAMTDELQSVKDEIQEKIVALKKSETQNKTLSKQGKVRKLCFGKYACIRQGF